MDAPAAARPAALDRPSLGRPRPAGPARRASRAAVTGYLRQARWTSAVTMPDWPHEYTVKAWRPDLAAQFEGVCQLIRTTGHVLAWPPPPAPAIYHNRYLTSTAGRTGRWSRTATAARSATSPSSTEPPPPNPQPRRGDPA